MPRAAFDLNEPDQDGNTPLHLVLMPDHTGAFLQLKNEKNASLEFLLNRGVNVDTKNVQGDTALHLAARINRTVLVRQLLSKMRFIDHKNNDGETPLQLAERLGHDKVVRAIADNGYAEGAISALRDGGIPGEVGELVTSYIYPNSAERGRKKFQKKQDTFQERYHRNKKRRRT